MSAERENLRMKKILALLLVAVIAMTAVACANNDVNDEEIVENDQESVSDTDAETEVESESDTEADDPSTSTDSSNDLHSIVEDIYAEKQTPFGVMTLDIDLSDPDALRMYTGLSSADKVSAAVASEAMIMSQAYSLVLVRVNDAADAQTVAEEMKNGIDTAKWLCVQADDLAVVTYEDLVMLIMIDSQLDISSAEIVDAFEKVCGGTLTSEL